jgi:lipopolysaccharide transport system permease protein
MSPDAGQTPTTVIRPRRGWVGIGFGELLAHHELLYFLVWRDLKVRFAQTAFGVAWAVLQPLLLMGILTLFLGRVSGLSSDEMPYHLFVLAGLVPWTFFSQSLSAAANSLVDSAALLTKVYFPRLLFPLAATGSHIVDFAIASVLLGLLAIVSGFLPSPTWVMVLPLGILAFFVALSVGLWLAALNVRYRDFRHAVPFLVQAWFFATPIAYSTDAVPETIRPILALNPMTGVVEGFQWAISNGATAAPIISVAVSAISTMIILAGGVAYFRRAERAFADII